VPPRSNSVMSIRTYFSSSTPRRLTCFAGYGKNLGWVWYLSRPFQSTVKPTWDQRAYQPSSSFDRRLSHISFIIGPKYCSSSDVMGISVPAHCKCAYKGYRCLNVIRPGVPTSRISGFSKSMVISETGPCSSSVGFSK